MRRTGTVSCLDFRENGVAGARALREAAGPTDVDPFILGSGDAAVLEIADGYGASGANDDDFADERAAAREAGVPFGIHAGPDHLRRLADRSVPVAVCPRANATLEVGSPPIRELLDHTTVALGTDNVMLNPPSMFREMADTVRRFDVTAREVLRMATTAGAEIAGLDCGVVASGRRAALVVLDGDSDNLAGSVDPVRAVVRRATAADVDRVLL